MIDGKYKQRVTDGDITGNLRRRPSPLPVWIVGLWIVKTGAGDSSDSEHLHILDQRTLVSICQFRTIEMPTVLHKVRRVVHRQK